MNRLKAFLLVSLLLALCLCCGAGTAEETELLYNGGFEQLDEDGLPDGWYTDAYYMNEGYTVFSVGSEEPADGSTYALIQNFAENDARFAQPVEVEPESLYRLSGWIRAEGIEDAGRGANLSVEGLYVFSDSVYESEGWTYIEWYGETDENQTEVTVFVRLGGYSGLTKGAAAFDGISLVKVDSIPGDGVAALWFKQPDTYDDTDDTDSEAGEASPAWPWLLVLSVLFLAASLLTIPVITAGTNDLARENKRPPAFFIACLAAAFLVRMVCSALMEGYDVDVTCFTAWGSTMANVGANGFYTANWCDYPPAYLPVLGLNSIVSSLLGGGTAVTRVVFRFVPCLCDVLCAALVYLIARGEGMDRNPAGILGLMTAFNPAVIVNSAAWGQMDSVLCLGLLSVVILAKKRKWLALMPLYMLCVLVKPQALMLGPLGLLAIVLDAVKHPEDRKPMLQGTAAAVILAAAVIVLFTGDQAWDWILTLYGNTLSSYAYATVNTTNLYYLLGGNWSAIADRAHAMAPVLLGTACAAAAVLSAYRRRGSGLHAVCLETAVYAAFAAAFAAMAVIGVTWTAVGTAAMVLAFAIVLPMYVRSGDPKDLPLLGGLLFLLLYVCGIKMHERYLFPALFLLAAAFAYRRDWRILPLLAIISCTLFVNVGIVLDNSIRLGRSYGHLNSDTYLLNMLLSAVNVCAVPWALWACADICVFGRVQASLPALLRIPAGKKPAKIIHEKPDPSLHWTRRDTCLILALTLVYASAALWSLGSTTAPQDPWKSTAESERIVVDLGEDPGTYRILYQAQVSYHDFSLEFSDDGETWYDKTWAEMNQGECFRWKYVVYYSGDSDSRSYSSYGDPQTFTARYVRVNAEQIGLTLNELIFRTEDGTVLPVTIVRQENANEASPLLTDASKLFNEQDALIGEPGWYNGTYFDEIYHARTAYEHLHGTNPYETTHPPLGKLIMAGFIAIFGMTPFGWRFGGALAGILMLPAMYLLGKQLTKKTLPAFVCSAMMALDCMHYTQTRIATIDSYPVLFIIIEFFFMARFMQRDFLREPLKKILPDLALCGLAMGCSIASKWIGCYAGAGLAVLFAWTVIRRLRAADVLRSPAEQETQNNAADAWHRVLTICLWCVLFFVAVPACIYLACYVPYFAYTKVKGLGDFVSKVIRAQVNMYSYHATPGLGMDHPFYSPWYEWPTIKRPMYYAMASNVPDGCSYAIFCFGNPAVWYAGIAGMAFTALLWLKRHIYVREGSSALCHADGRVMDIVPAFILIGFLAQFLPWVLVPRGTYIYHYFASIPFLCLSVMLLLNKLTERFERIGRTVTYAYLVFCLICFIAFFPYASGMLTPTGWLDCMKRFLHVYY